MERLIIVLVVVLAIIAIAQLLKVYQLSSDLKGNREEEIPEKDNKLNANLFLVFMIAFYAFVIWLYAKYGVNNYGKGPAASKEGETLDWLFDLNMIIITIVFFLTNSLLFGFAWKYYYRKDRKALYYPHNNKLELLWTVVPAAVLAVIIILGLKTWFDVTERGEGTAENALKQQNVELYSRQFDWHIRYAGDDNAFGQSDYKLVSGTNPLGVITTGLIEQTDSSMAAEVVKLEAQLEEQGDYLPDWQYDELETKIIRTNRLRRRLRTLSNEMKEDMTDEKNPIDWDARAENDVFALGEMYLIKDVKYNFRLRSQDVIHSAYLPHFRMQMNTVPGAVTYMSFTPTITTEEMREKMNNPEFDFILVCNKICGKSHSQMRMNVIVGDADGFREWLAEKGKRVDGKKYAYVPYKDGDNYFPAATAEDSSEGEDGEEVADQKDN